MGSLHKILVLESQNLRQTPVNTFFYLCFYFFLYVYFHFDSLQFCSQLTHRDPKYLFGKIVTSLTNRVSIKRTSRVFNTSYALSKWPHLHRAYVISGGIFFATAVDYVLPFFVVYANGGLHWSRSNCKNSFSVEGKLIAWYVHEESFGKNNTYCNMYCARKVQVKEYHESLFASSLKQYSLKRFCLSLHLCHPSM